ncbi:hypothetical protein J6590_075438 [Homalodisca vitripennis]|nr:hypothetical protein J6590_075438 [Homalodisca vitripennis]
MPRFVVVHKSIFYKKNLQTVAQAFVASPGKSTHKASADLEISRRTMQIIIKQLKIKPYGPYLLQALHEDDYDRSIRSLAQKNNYVFNIHSLIWQQDGAPAHFRIQPPLSPDLTPCDFSLWGIIKETLYAEVLGLLNSKLCSGIKNNGLILHAGGNTGTVDDDVNCRPEIPGIVQRQAACNCISAVTVNA